MTFGVALIVAFLFSWWRYAKNKPRREARLAREREEERRRDNRRRKWALALADILVRRNGLRVKGVTLELTFSDDKRQIFAQQVKKELGIAETLDGDALRQQVAEILRRWPSGIGNSPRDFYGRLAAQGQVRDALAFDCMRTAFLTLSVAGLGWCSEEQAWLVLLLNGQRAQDSFTGWEDYATAYVRARQEWLALHDTPPAAAGRDLLEVTRYLEDRTGNWRTIPWNSYKIFDPI